MGGRKRRNWERSFYPPEGGKHCWVLDGDRRFPGLLTLWKRDPVGWTGLVCFPMRINGQVYLVQQWIPGDELRSTDPEPERLDLEPFKD